MRVSSGPHGQEALPPSESIVARKRVQPDLEASSGHGRDADIAHARPGDRALPEVHLLDYVRVISRRRWTAASVVALVLLCTVGYLSTATPMYEASTTLLIESDKRNSVAFGNVTDQSPTTDDYYLTQYRLLASRTLAERTLDTLKLWDHAEFDASGRAERSGVRGAISRALRAVASAGGPLVDPPSGVEPDDTSRRTATITKFLNQLAVSPVRNTRIVEVKFRSTDPALAATVANAHAQAYIQQNLESKFGASKDLSTWLAKQLAEQREKVEESEIAVQRYREEHNALGLDAQHNIADQKLSDLSSAVTKAKTARIEKEAIYRQLEAVEHDTTALGTFPAILSNAYIQQIKMQLADLQRQAAQMSDRLGSRHPDLVRVTTAIEAAEAKLQAATAQVVASLRTDYLGAVAQETRLTEALKAQEREGLAFNRAAIEGNVLSRDAESNRQLYQGLLQRTKESAVIGELEPINIRIVDRADVPRRPVSPNWASSLVLAVLGAPFLAVGLVVFLEYLNKRLRTPDEVLAHLGLPTLGLVPRVAGKARGPHLFMNNGVPGAFSEAFRTIRTSVLLSSEGHGARTVLVTSATPGEGKTLSASNLAISFAQLGERVLLVDCDTRRPSVHLMFDVEQEPGLTDLLAGRSRARSAISPSSVANLWVLPAGMASTSPAELLGSKAFKELLSSLDGLYDRVVLDSPPVLAVTDATILAHMAFGIVFVVSAAATERQAATTAVTCLDRAGGHIIGVVLNHANLSDRHGYGSYDGYY